ncbi:MAG: esterase-like activity of phytase family protein, partial [Rhizobiales bacterium]|nr:esterase-like activity of phytase family protein [Hyphomicrobiales bacterium]
MDRRTATATLASCLLLLAAGPVTAPASGQTHGNTPDPTARQRVITVNSSPIPFFDPRDTGRRHFGRLAFRGGLVLSADDKAFGGISSIRLEPDGERFLAVTDRGQWVRGRILYRGGVPAGIAEAEMAPIRGPDGRPITARRWYDSESLATDGTTAWVGLERVHQILKFDMRTEGLAAPGMPIAVPPEVKKLPANRGLEGMIAAPPDTPLAGTLIAFSERGLDEAGHIRGFLIGGATPGLFGVVRHDEFDITDAAMTPAGDVFVLERSFSLLRGPGMRLRMIARDAIAPGAVVDGTMLFEADFRYQIDNMEGLAVHVAPSGETILTIVSDDNFSILQRTLLMQFAVIDPCAA